MDGYTKGIVGMGVADNNQSDKFVRVLHRARLKWGMPECLRTDRGGENVLAQSISSRSEVSITVVSLLESQYRISQLSGNGRIQRNGIEDRYWTSSSKFLSLYSSIFECMLQFYNVNIYFIVT